MNIETVSSLWPLTVRVIYITWMIDFKIIWSLYFLTNFSQFNLTQIIWSFSHIWSVNLSSIKKYSVASISIRNFKYKLKKSLTTVPSASRGFQTQTLNRFWIKKTRKILNDILNFITFFMKHKSFLKCSDYLLKNHHHHCHWNIMSQNFNKRADH